MINIFRSLKTVFASGKKRSSQAGSRKPRRFLFESLEPRRLLTGGTLTITSTPATTATVGQAYSYTLQTNAPSGDTVTVSTTTTNSSGATVSTLPTGMTFDSSSDTFSWTPSGNQNGTTLSYTATVTDSTANTTATLGPVNVQVASNNALTVIAAPPNIAIGSPVLVGFNDSNTSATNFTVTTSDPSELTATLMPSSNPVLQIVTNLGTMDFQLLQNYTPDTIADIESLISEGAYDPSTFTDYSGTFGMAVGTGTSAIQTPAITFQANNLTATANNIEAALVNLGFTGATVSVAAGSAAPNFSFNVKFPSSEPALSYEGGSIPDTFTNSATSASATQTITFTTDTPSFYRVIQGFMEQGGITGSGVGTDIPLELNPNLRFTSTGLLAMANDGVDGNSSEFFITDPSVTNGATSTGAVSTYADMTDGFLDFRYTIFGKLISGDSVREAIVDTPVTTNSSGEDSEPVTPITIESMSITTDPQAGVLMLTALPGATGTYTVTVNDGQGNSQTFSINASDPTTSAPITNSFDPPNPWVLPVTVGVSNAGTNTGDQIYTSANTAVSFTPQGESADGVPSPEVNVNLLLDIPSVSGAEVDDSFLTTSTNTSDPAQNPNPNMTVTDNNGTWTVTPAAGFYGVQLLEVTSQSATAASWDAGSNIDPVYRAFVPVFVAPPAPTLSSISAGGQTIAGPPPFRQQQFRVDRTDFQHHGNGRGRDGLRLRRRKHDAHRLGHRYRFEHHAHQQRLVYDRRWFALVPRRADLAHGGPCGLRQLDLVQRQLQPRNAVQPAGQYRLQPVLRGHDADDRPGRPRAADHQRVGAIYTYAVQTNAPAGDAITVTPIELPTGMTLNASDNTFSWTPTSAQLGTSLAFEATVMDSQGRTTTIGPVDISVVIGLTPVQVPVNTKLGGDVTVVFSGGNVLVYDNLGKDALSYQSFKPTDTIQLDLPAAQANSVLVILPSTPGAAIPAGVVINGIAGSTSNQVTLFGSSRNDTIAVGGNAASADGVEVTSNNVQKLTLAGMAGDNDYVLDSSSMPVWIVNTGNQGTLDFSHDAAGVAVNLGLDQGQGQHMTGWGNNLMLYGVLNEIIGTQYADTLTGGPASTTYIHGGAGNDTITGGSGNNILVGGGGNDTIIGGANKNLLIAGSGTSDLYADGSENMAFGGSTSDDTNDQALLNLLNQGPTVPFSFSVRLALASIAADPSLLSDMPKFVDSGAHDIIFSNGSRDWFVPGKNGVVEKM